MKTLPKIQIICSSLLINVFINAQNMPLNVQQVAHISTSSFQVPTDLSDIWGWVDSQGNEYALVGTNEGTSIFSLANPSQPVEVFFEHFSSANEFKQNISPDFEDEPIGTNMDVEILYEMFQSGSSFEDLIRKGNTVPEGKKPVAGLDAVKNMKKKFKD